MGREVLWWSLSLSSSPLPVSFCVCAYLHTHTHTHTYIYIYIYTCIDEIKRPHCEFETVGVVGRVIGYGGWNRIVGAKITVITQNCFFSCGLFKIYNTKEQCVKSVMVKRTISEKFLGSKALFRKQTAELSVCRQIPSSKITHVYKCVMVIIEDNKSFTKLLLSKMENYYQ